MYDQISRSKEIERLFLAETLSKICECDDLSTGKQVNYGFTKKKL